MKASEVKRGEAIEINQQPCIVKEVQVKNPSSRGASTLYHIKANDVITGQKVEQTATGTDFFKQLDVSRRAVQYLFKDDDFWTFMDTEDFTQHAIANSDIGDQAYFITDGIEGLSIKLLDDKVIGLELPQSVSLEVIETDPAIKGATASSRTKPATLSTGLVVQVPEYLAVGEVIKVNTDTQKFMSRDTS